MTNLVAVYGTLRHKQGNHGILAHIPDYAKGTVSGFDMYHLGGFPALQHGKGTAVVEVYQVDDEKTMQRLDWLEGFRSPDDPNNFYDREITDVTLESGAVVKAWIYYIDSPLSGRSIPSGDWVKDK